MSHLSLPPYVLLTGEYTFNPRPPTCRVQCPGLLMTDTYIVSKKIVALFSAAQHSLVHRPPSSINHTLFLTHSLSLSLSLKQVFLTWCSLDTLQLENASLDSRALFIDSHKEMGASQSVVFVLRVNVHACIHVCISCIMFKKRSFQAC